MNPLARPHLPPVFDLGGDAVLRAVETDDAEALYAVVDSNREHLRVWLPWVDGSREAEDTRAFLERDAESRARGVTATFLILDNGAIEGMIGLHDIDSVNRSFLIGYWLAKHAEGRGRISGACRRLVAAAFEEFDMERAVIRCAVGNARSSAVPKRLGFTLEGIERHGQRLHDRFVDLEIYSLLRAELQLS